MNVRIQAPRVAILAILAFVASIALFGCQAQRDSNAGDQQLTTDSPSGAGGPPEITGSTSDETDDRGSGGSFELILRDPDVVAWMNINNKFTENWTEDDIRHGVLIQLGDYSTTSGLFNKVTFAGVGANQPDPSELKVGDFEWIRILAEDFTNPINIQEIKYLYPKPGSVTECTPLEQCVRENCLAGVPVGDRSTYRHPCVRYRSLHADFFPKSGITFWVGGNGYDLEFELEEGPNRPLEHPKQTFSTRDSVKVYYKTAASPEFVEIENVHTIEVLWDDGVGHGDHSDPPMDGTPTPTGP